MTTRKTTPAPAILIAIDVSKARNDILIEIPGVARRRRLVVPNTCLEHDRFIGLLKDLGAPVTAAFEGDAQLPPPARLPLARGWRLATARVLSRAGKDA